MRRSRGCTASREYSFDEKRVAFSGGAQLADAMAKSTMAHACYLEHWLEYLYGRRMAESERPLVDRLARQSKNDAAVLSLLEELVASDAFRARPVEGGAP